MKVKGALGEAALQEAIYRPVIEVLADEHYAPKTIGQLNDHAKLKSVGFQQLCQVLLVLSGDGHVHPAQQATKESQRRCTAFNRYICGRARDNADIAYLAAPVTGCGIPVERSQQLFLLATHQGKKTIAEQAKFAWECISGQGELIVKDGKQLETGEENITELTRLAGIFNEKRRPHLKALGID